MRILHFSVCSMHLSIVGVKSAFRDCCVLCSARKMARAGTSDDATVAIEYRHKRNKQKKFSQRSCGRKNSNMDSLSGFLRNIFIIGAFTFIILKLMMKKWKWMERKVCKSFICAFRQINDRTAARQQKEPTLTTITFRGNGTVPRVASENTRNRQVKKPIQTDGNKKLYKQKETLLNGNNANNDRLPIPFTVKKIARVEECVSSKSNFRRTGKAVPSTRPSLWEESCGKRQDRTHYKHLLKPRKFEEHAEKKDKDLITEKGVSSLKSTCSHWERYDVWNEKHVSQRLNNQSDQLNQVLKVNPHTKCNPISSSAPKRFVRLWSVDMDEETQRLASHDRPNGEVENDYAPAMRSKESQHITSQLAKSNDCVPGHNTFNVLSGMTKAMVRLVLIVKRTSYVCFKGFLAGIKNNWRVKECRNIISMIMAYTMTVFTLSAGEAFCSYVHALKGKATKNVTLRVLWKTVDLFISAVSNSKSIVSAFYFRIQAAVSQLMASKLSMPENTSHEETNVLSNFKKGSKVDRSAVIPVVHREQLSSHSEDDHSGGSSFTPITKGDIPITSYRCCCSENSQNTGISFPLQPSRSRSTWKRKSAANYFHPPVYRDMQSKALTKDKKSGKEALCSVLSFTGDKPFMATVGRKRQQKRLVTSANEDLRLSTPSVTCQTKDKITPRLLPPSNVRKVASPKAHTRNMSPRQRRLDLITSVKVSKETQTSSVVNNTKESEAVAHKVMEHAASRPKRSSNGEERASTMENARGSTIIAGTGVNTKRQAIGRTGTISRMQTTALTSATYTSQADEELPSKGITEQVELMEVTESGKSKTLFTIIIPEEMEVTNELTAEPETRQEEMDIGHNPGALTEACDMLQTPLSSNGLVESDAMETEQEHSSLWHLLSFSLPSFLASPALFSFKPREEEMEVDQQVVPFPFSNADHEEMDITEESLAMAKPFMNTMCIAPAAGLERPDTACKLSQQPMMEFTSLASPHEELPGNKRPFAPTIEMFEKNEQQIMQSVAQKQVFQEPVTLLQHLHSPTNSAAELSYKNMVSVRQVGIRQDSLPSEMKGQEIVSAIKYQQTVEQIQLAAPTDPAYYLDEDCNSDLRDDDDDDDENSGSDFEDDSEDEFELDLETIEKFSDLESSPDHTQLITKIMMEKESTQWHSVSDSDSNNKDFGKHVKQVELDLEAI